MLNTPFTKDDSNLLFYMIIISNAIGYLMLIYEKPILPGKMSIINGCHFVQVEELKSSHF